MDVLEVLRDHLPVFLASALAVGLLQGAVLGAGLRRRFPSVRRHARAASGAFLVLSAASALAGVAEFASPSKVALSEISAPRTAEELIGMLLGLLGLDAGFFASVAVFASVVLVVAFRLADMPRTARYMVFGLSVVTVSVSMVARLTDYTPAIQHVMIYAAYQIGVTAGAFAVLCRRVT